MPLPRPCLMLVTDRSLCGGADGLADAVEAAVEGGADAVQLREKSLPASELSTLARRLREVTRGALLVVNGPLEVATEAGADGVHLPEDAPPVRRPRQGFLVGRSIHSPVAARRAEAEGADYLVAGPVYETRSHPGREPAGLALIEQVTQIVRIPVLAIGGVTAGRVEEVVRAGASGVAVISAVLAQRDRRAAAGKLRRALDAAWAGAGAVRQ
ncbi:MAG TPA: thiamine phosphate synthase [Dehalococcoidia bacterium]|nr:thiamine phosphate synthase [Dehalococcoidia bacterium]